MAFCIYPHELRRALADLKVAEKNGFKHCLAVFRMSRDGEHIAQRVATYGDLYERASANDGGLDWGRFQEVSRRFRFSEKDRKLVPLRSKDANKAKREVADRLRALKAEAGLVD